MYEFVCRNCGKHNTGVVAQNRTPKVFCNRQCFEEYQKKRKAAKENKAKRYALSPQKTPPEQCEKCRYGCLIGRIQGCGYFDIPGNTSRLLLHPEGLPDECQEFERRKRGRPKKT